MSWRTCKWRGTIDLAVATIIALFCFCSTCAAHFNLNVNLRIIHVERQADQIIVMVRLPMAYLVADKLGPVAADGSVKPAPFTQNRIENGELMHYLDADALRANPQGLAALVSEGHELRTNGNVAVPQFVALRAFPALQQSAFASWQEAEKSFDGPVYDAQFPATYVGDTVVDAKLIYSVAGDEGPLHLRSTLNPGIPEQDQTANLIVVSDNGRTSTYRIRGLLAEPVSISPSRINSLFSFVKSGVVHILEGIDHVLFVICLVLGALSLPILVWRVTGFTIGHSVTLALGFFGYVPRDDWFVPLVEAGIAASIVLAAWLALAEIKENYPFLMTALMGMLHGLGFSFVLTQTLKMDSPDIWPSLLAFNVGVEIGQLAIVVLCWPLLHLCYRKLGFGRKSVQVAVAVPCIVIASLWTGQRLTMLVGTLS